nr:MAG TPA: hypothetical protein [Caudoviricetes sp.]
MHRDRIAQACGPAIQRDLFLGSLCFFRKEAAP